MKAESVCLCACMDVHVYFKSAVKNAEQKRHISFFFFPPASLICSFPPNTVLHVCLFLETKPEYHYCPWLPFQPDSVLYSRRYSKLLLLLFFKISFFLCGFVLSLMWSVCEIEWVCFESCVFKQRRLSELPSLLHTGAFQPAGEGESVVGS